MATQLDYVAAPGCPSVSPFRSGRHRAASDTMRSARTRRTGSSCASNPLVEALEGRLEWRDATGEAIGEQSFPSRTGDCDELMRAMGFALALQIQLMAATVAEVRSAPPPAPATTPRSRRAGTAAVNRAPAGGPDPKHGDRASDTTRHRGGPSVLVGVGAAAGLGVELGPRRPRPPVRDRGVVARRGRARGRGQRPIDHASRGRGWLLSRADSGEPRRVWRARSPGAYAPSARLASSGSSDRV